MSRAYLIPVTLITDKTVSASPFPVPDYMNSAYIDKLKNLVVGKQYTLQAGDVGYPELLSARHYNTTDYWWIICMFNGCVNPLEDMKAGMVWSLPTDDSIQILLSNKVGSRSNRIGTVVTV